MLKGLWLSGGGGTGGGVKRWRIPSFELNINLCCCCFQRNWKTRRNVCTHRRKCKLWAHSSASQICGSVYCEWNLIHLFVFQNSDTQKKEEYWPFDFLSTALSLLLCGMEPPCQRYSINLKAATAFPKIHPDPITAQKQSTEGTVGNWREMQRWQCVCNSNVVGRGLRSVRRAVSLGEAYPWLGYILPCWLKRHEAAGGNHGSRDFCQRDSPVIAEQLSCNLKHI